MQNQTINSLIATHNVKVFGYPAFQELADRSNKSGDTAVLSALPAGVVLDAGYNIFYSPIQTRNISFGSAQEILDKELPIGKYTARYVETFDVDYEGEVIISRHQAAVDMLISLYPQLEGVQVITGTANEEDIKNKIVYGTLPTYLAAKAAAMISVTIPGYNFNTMADLSADDLSAQGLTMVVKEPVEVKPYELKYKEITLHSNNMWSALGTAYEFYHAIRTVFTSIPDFDVIESYFSGNHEPLNRFEEESEDEDNELAEVILLEENKITFSTWTSGREITVEREKIEKEKPIESNFDSDYEEEEEKEEVIYYSYRVTLDCGSKGSYVAMSDLLSYMYTNTYLFDLVEKEDRFITKKEDSLYVIDIEGKVVQMSDYTPSVYEELRQARNSSVARRQYDSLNNELIILSAPPAILEESVAYTEDGGYQRNEDMNFETYFDYKVHISENVVHVDQKMFDLLKDRLTKEAGFKLSLLDTDEFGQSIIPLGSKAYVFKPGGGSLAMTVVTRYMFKYN